MPYAQQEKLRAIAWKTQTTTLPEQARQPAPYVRKDGTQRPPAYEFCLPAEFAAYSLLPEVRETAPALFVELAVRWHAGVGNGPSSHLLSSQVRCANALTQMVTEPPEAYHRRRHVRPRPVAG